MVKCYQCGKLGHISTNCNQRNAGRAYGFSGNFKKTFRSGIRQTYQDNVFESLMMKLEEYEKKEREEKELKKQEMLKKEIGELFENKMNDLSEELRNLKKNMKTNIDVAGKKRTQDQRAELMIEIEDTAKRKKEKKDLEEFIEKKLEKKFENQKRWLTSVLMKLSKKTADMEEDDDDEEIEFEEEKRKTVEEALKIEIPSYVNKTAIKDKKSDAYAHFFEDTWRQLQYDLATDTKKGMTRKTLDALLAEHGVTQVKGKKVEQVKALAKKLLDEAIEQL